MSALPERREAPSLEEAIRQQIALGEKDPLDIARKMVSLHGADWVAEQLATNWEEIIAEIARQKLGNDRRAAVSSIGDLARQSKERPSKRDVVLQSLFVPGKGYIRFGDATDQDLADVEAYRLRLAGGLVRWAEWFGAVRVRLTDQGVRTVKEIKGSLPPLPSQELPA